MDCMKLPSQRGPVRASLLNHPRIPRHLLRQQPGEGEQKTVAKLADQGDSGSEHVPLLGKKELSVVEKHQLQAPAQMMAQLRRNSLNQQGSAAGQVPQLHSSISTPQGMVTTSACLQGLPDSGKESLNPQCDRTAQQGEQHSVIDGSTVRRRQLIHSVLEERGSKEGEGGSAITTSPPVTKTQCSTSSGEGQETRRPPLSVNSLESESLKNYLPFSVKNKVANSNTAPPFPIVRRNSLQDIQSALVSDSGSVSTGSKTNIPLEAVKPTAVPMFLSRHQSFPKSLYRPLPSNGQSSSARAENKPDGEDFSRAAAVSSSRHADACMQFSRDDLSLESSSTITGHPASGKCSQRTVRDLKTMMESLASQREGLHGDGVNPADHDSPVRKRQIITSPDCQQPSMTQGRKSQEVKPLSYCKLLVKKREESFSVIIVGQDINNLLEITELLSEPRKGVEINMIGFGVSSEDLVYEMSHQMEVQLVMQKLHALPPGGQYSARRLINLSTSPLSHRKPQEWDDLLYRFKGDSILLKPEEVRYFEPCDYQLPDGEMTYRNLDTDARVIAKW